MATQNERKGNLTITSIAEDWVYSTSKPPHWPDRPRLSSICFIPGATSDKLIVKEENESGPEVIWVTAETVNSQKIKYFHGGVCIPFIDFSECILSAGHMVMIQLWRDA